MALTLLGAFKGLSLAPSSSFLRGDRATLPGGATGGAGVVTLPVRGLTIQMAHKKGVGSNKNGRDSKGQRLGVKIYGDQLAKPGAIIIRQRVTKRVQTSRNFWWIFYGPEHFQWARAAPGGASRGAQPVPPLRPINSQIFQKPLGLT
ncbi:hypothetical protein ACQJBY_048058 [Aegilops geniculata]